MNPHAAQDAPRQRLIPEHLFVTLIEKIVDPESRRNVPGDVIRRAGVYIFVAGIACDSEGEVGILPLADETAANHQRPAARRYRNGQRARISRAADELVADPGIG